MGSRTVPDAMTVDRVVAVLAGLSLLCVFLLPSQSGASFPTYLLALIVLVGGRDRWRVFIAGESLVGVVGRAAGLFLVVGLVVERIRRRAARFRFTRDVC